MSGRLFMLFLANQTSPDGSIEVKDLKVELLGEVFIDLKCFCFCFLLLSINPFLTRIKLPFF